MPMMSIYLSPADESWLIAYANKHNTDARELAENVVAEAILDIRRKNGEFSKRKQEKK